MAKSIQELAERFLKTSREEDFKDLYDRIKPGLYNHCKTILVDEEVAQDAVSKTFEKIWVNVAQYNTDRGNFSTWAYNIARNESFQIIKKSKKFSPLVHEGSNSDGGNEEFIPLSDVFTDDFFTEPEWEVNNKEGNFEDLYDDVLIKIQNLPSIYKDILIDRELYKMKYQEIADKYGMKKRAVATRIRRARLKVASYFPGIKLNFID